MDAFLDFLFTIFHCSLILFNLTAWMWRRIRRIHLVCISLTLLSWFGLGAYFGWGYCPFTDWHWQVKSRLGESDLPASYIKYLVDTMTGVRWDPFGVDVTTVLLGVAAFVLSCWFNWRDRKALTLEGGPPCL